MHKNNSANPFLDGEETPQIDWTDLSLDEQRALMRMGYTPPKGTLLHGNMDLELQDGS